MSHTKFFARLPTMVWVVALLATLLHLAPFVRAELQSPPGWTFTGNLSGSPDHMQYRVWSRLAAENGPIIVNTFTAEPNSPHIPVFFYYAVGSVASLVGSTPEHVYAYGGAFFAFLFAILLFAIVRYFLKSPYTTWVVYLVILIGGGLGAYLKTISLYNPPVISHAVNRWLVSAPVFEDYRSHYVFSIFGDSHFLIIYLATLAAIMAIFFAIKEPSRVRTLLAGFACFVMTFLHVYEAVTVLAIIASVGVLLWYKGLLTRVRLLVLAGCSGVLVGSAAVIGYLFHTSGLPGPVWSGIPILFAILVVSYPLAWFFIAKGVVPYWKKAGFDEVFLLGWGLGCTALTLSAPFYSYPDRGTMTMQVVIYIIAGGIYFAQRERVSGKLVIAGILLLMATPTWELYRLWQVSSFSPERPFKWTNVHHQEIARTLQERATAEDILLAGGRDLLWLAPEHPGKHFAGHFFLTVNYETKANKVRAFYKSNPAQQVDLIEQEDIRFVFISEEQDPSRFTNTPELQLLSETEVGSLFEYTGE